MKLKKLLEYIVSRDFLIKLVLILVIIWLMQHTIKLPVFEYSRW